MFKIAPSSEQPLPRIEPFPQMVLMATPARSDTATVSTIAVRSLSHVCTLAQSTPTQSIFSMIFLRCGTVTFLNNQPGQPAVFHVCHC